MSHDLGGEKLVVYEYHPDLEDENFHLSTIWLRGLFSFIAKMFRTKEQTNAMLWFGKEDSIKLIYME